jgi:KaiC/GvpD/RAD55 family RecA-like ATPase
VSEQLARIQAALDERVAEGLRLVTLDEFIVKPALSWLIRDMLQPQSVAVVFGPPKGGKTFTTTDLLMHGAHGMEWHGHEVPRPLRVAFLAGEGRTGLKVRLHAWLEHHDTAQLGGDFRLLPEALSLPDRVTEVVELLRVYRPDAVAVDTLNAYYGPGDENSTQDMSSFVASLRRVRDAVGCAVIVLHHTGLADAGRERGSNVLRAAADVVIQVGKDEGGTGLVGFQVVTARDFGEWEQPLSLRLKRVETDWTDDQGRPMATCIVESATMPVTLAGRGRKLSDKQRITVDVVRELAAERGKGNDQALIARADIIERAVARGVNRTVVYRHIEQLADRMRWRVVEPGGLMVTL